MRFFCIHTIGIDACSLIHLQTNESNVWHSNTFVKIPTENVIVLLFVTLFKISLISPQNEAPKKTFFFRFWYIQMFFVNREIIFSKKKNVVFETLENPYTP